MRTTIVKQLSRIRRIYSHKKMRISRDIYSTRA